MSKGVIEGDSLSAETPIGFGLFQGIERMGIVFPDPIVEFCLFPNGRPSPEPGRAAVSSGARAPAAAGLFFVLSGFLVDGPWQTLGEH